jgi:hypothetical protein
MGRGVKIVGLNLGDEENKDAGCRPADSTHNPRGKKNEVNRGMGAGPGFAPNAPGSDGKRKGRKRKGNESKKATPTPKAGNRMEASSKQEKARGKRQNKRDRVTRRRTKDQLRRRPAVSAEVDRCKGDEDKKGCNRTPCVLGSVSA